jgi:hypothetical protein
MEDTQPKGGSEDPGSRPTNHGEGEGGPGEERRHFDHRKSEVGGGTVFPAAAE